MKSKEAKEQLPDIVNCIKQETFEKDRTDYRYKNYETTEGIEVLSSLGEFKFVEKMMYSSRYSSIKLVIKRISNIELKRDIERHDLPKSLTDPLDPGYGRWTYKLEFVINGEIRKFLRKMKEKDIGIGSLYNYPDFEVEGKEEIELGTTNVVRNLFHDVFVDYASKRL